MFILPDLPETPAVWLSSTERALAQRRMIENAGAPSEADMQGFRFHGLRTALGDWKVWWLAIAMTSIQLSMSFSIFLPTLSATLGYNLKTTLLLCAPPWLFATVTAFIISRYEESS